jgi:thiamine kinase-like enzyme
MTASAPIRPPAGGLEAALRAAGIAAVAEPMADTGLAHAHYRLAGTGLIARLPKQSQMRLGAAENLAYQAACYRRAARGGHAPRLAQVLLPVAGLPRGGRVVEEIAGRPARLPEDLDAIVDAMASIHTLPVPARAGRAPILAPADPLADLLEEIGAQAAYLDPAGIAPETTELIRDGITDLSVLVAAPARPAARLISFDAHPGNFLVEPSGRAVLVDLEKCRYSAPQLDLAHATLYTSTTWDVASHAVLGVEEVARVHERWIGRIGGADWARDAGRWLVPMRRAMWLWSMTWCAKWRVLSARAARGDGEGEDWSAEASGADLVAHVRDRVDHYLAAATARMVADEFRVLDTMLAPSLRGL